MSRFTTPGTDQKHDTPLTVSPTYDRAPEEALPETADYIRLSRGDTETLRASLETIRRTANTILEGLEAERTS